MPALPEVTRTVIRKGQVERQLGQTRPGVTTNVVLYSPGTGTRGVVTRIIALNTGVANILIRVFHDDDGTTFDQGTAIRWDTQIPPTPAVNFHEIIAETDDGFGVSFGGSIAIRTDTINDATFTAYGYEIIA